MTSDKKKLMKEADRLWSLAIYKLAKGRCGMCNKHYTQYIPTEVSSHHVVPRNRKTERWKLCNGILLCTFDCHRMPHDEPDAWEVWLEQNKPHLAEYRRDHLNVAPMRVSEDVIESLIDIMKGVLHGD